jgi:hypothetical protein
MLLKTHKSPICDIWSGVAADLYTAGTNDMGETGYNGPMPPNGHGLHNYYFWILALDKAVELEPGLSLWRLLEKTEPHIIGMNRLIGRYKRD